LDFKDFALPAERRRVSIASARAGIVLAYSTKGTPASVQLTWDRFNRYLWTVQTVAYARDQTLKKTLSRIGGDNIFAWRNPVRQTAPPLRSADLTVPPGKTLSVAVATLVVIVLMPVIVLVARRRGATPRTCWLLAGVVLGAASALWPYGRWETANPFLLPPPLSDERAQAIFATLHKSMYRAFDYRSEGDVYDALAKTVDGPLLRELYLKVRQGLEMQEQGGAVARIREVKILEGIRQPLRSPVSLDRQRNGRALGPRSRPNQRVRGCVRGGTLRRSVEAHGVGSAPRETPGGADHGPGMVTRETEIGAKHLRTRRSASGCGSWTSRAWYSTRAATFPAREITCS
jgi:hypothetical protein